MKETAETGVAAMETERVAEDIETSGAAAEEQPTVASTKDKTMEDATQETPQENQATIASNASETEEGKHETRKD